MKFYRHISYYLHALFLMMPFHVFASEENMEVQASVKTSHSLNADALTSDPMSSSYLLQLVIGLFVVLLCILVLAWFAKKMNRFHSLAGDSLKVIGGLSMGSRERVVLLQVGKDQLLLGVSSGQINTLHVLNTPIETMSNGSDTSVGNSFLDKLKTVMADASSIEKQNKQ